MTKYLMLIAALGLFPFADLSFAAEPLSEESLDKITAQGQENVPQEPMTNGSTATVGTHSVGHTNLTLQPNSQTHLRGGAINNAAGRNQIANGINVR